MRKIGPNEGIIKDVDRPDFVNLNLYKNETATNTETSFTGSATSLMEIRVSPDAIIEVYGRDQVERINHDRNSRLEGEATGVWGTRSFARTEMPLTLGGNRRAIRVKYLVAYGAFAILAAAAVWYAIG